MEGSTCSDSRASAVLDGVISARRLSSGSSSFCLTISESQVLDRSRWPCETSSSWTEQDEESRGRGGSIREAPDPLTDLDEETLISAEFSIPSVSEGFLSACGHDKCTMSSRIPSLRPPAFCRQ